MGGLPAVHPGGGAAGPRELGPGTDVADAVMALPEAAEPVGQAGHQAQAAAAEPVRPFALVLIAPPVRRLRAAVQGLDDQPVAAAVAAETRCRGARAASWSTAARR